MVTMGTLIMPVLMCLLWQSHRQVTGYTTYIPPEDFTTARYLPPKTTEEPPVNATYPPITSEPNMRSCAGPNGECDCHFTGNWDMAEEYEALKVLRERANTLTDIIMELDAGLLRDTMNKIAEKMSSLKKTIYNQKVSVSVGGLMETQKSVDIMWNLVGQLDLNYTSPEVIALLQEELKTLDDMLADLWSSHPTLDLSELNNKIKDLETRLANCRENYNITYFRGDSLPTDLEYDGWCEDFEIAGIGDVITHRFESHSYWIRGNFMKDPFPQTDANRSMIFLRNYRGAGSYNLNYERYRNYTDFISAKNGESMFLRQTFGDGYTLYKGAIYDHSRTYKLSRYDVASGSLTETDFRPSTIKYLNQDSDTHADIKADETGLYVIYVDTNTNGNGLMISQYDPATLVSRKSWRTSRHKNTVCAAFMACGKLYTIDNCWSRGKPPNSHQQYVYDTKTGEESYVRLHVPSKFGQIRQLSYNSRERVLFGWDNGHMVTYQIIWESKNNV